MKSLDNKQLTVDDLVWMHIFNNPYPDYTAIAKGLEGLNLTPTEVFYILHSIREGDYTCP